MAGAGSLLHTATINGQSVRFFRPPLNEKDFPWCALDDLHAALELPEALRGGLMT